MKYEYELPKDKRREWYYLQLLVSNFDCSVYSIIALDDGYSSIRFADAVSYMSYSFLLMEQK